MEEKKFIENLEIQGISVMTDTGWEKIISFHKTISYKIWRITTEKHELFCADKHIVFDNNGLELFIENLSIGDSILTIDGIYPILNIEVLDKYENMYDLQVKSQNKRYYTNGILSHNTTVALDILSDLAANDYRVLFISAEMTRIDLYGYVQRYPKFGEVDILFTGEYCDSNPKTVIESSLKPGYDIVLIDSFAEVQEDIKEVLKLTSAGSEKWLIDLMISHNLAENDTRTHTTFIAIQQVTKGGVFVGSNKLKHAVTGMLELRYDQATGSQFMMFNKNRRGSVNKRMFYSLSATGDVEYDLKRFSNDENAREALSHERTLIESEGNAFDTLFGFAKEEEKDGL